MKIITHNDRFHADDVMAMAALRIRFGSEITEVVRTRDEEIIKTGDIVFDVGNIYDADANRFDHHQAEGAGVRENGIPYAAFGAVWKAYGLDICGSQEAADLIDKKVVQPIDAYDNGLSLYTYTQPDIHEYVFNVICASFGSTWKEEENYDEGFSEVVDIAEKILRREIKVAQDKYEAIPLVEKAYQDAEDKRLVIMDEYYPWASVIEKYPEVLYVIFPSKEKNFWRILAVQEADFVNRKDLPSAWGGLRDEELERVTGITGSVFCHKGLFFAVANSREAAILLAKKAIEL